jgi:hypothetical protein
MLPHTRVGGISGLLEIINDRGGREDLPKLAESLQLEVDDLLPAVDALVLLGFAEVAHGDVTITAAGREFATADVHRSHEIFKEQLLKNVRFISTVLGAMPNSLNTTPTKNGCMKWIIPLRLARDVRLRSVGISFFSRSLSSRGNRAMNLVRGAPASLYAITPLYRPEAAGSQNENSQRSRPRGSQHSSHP